MNAMASEITGVSIVSLMVYSGADKKNSKAPRHWALWGQFTGDPWFSSQRAINAEMFPFDDVIMVKNYNSIFWYKGINPP